MNRYIQIISDIQNRSRNAKIYYPKSLYCLGSDEDDRNLINELLIVKIEQNSDKYKNEINFYGSLEDISTIANQSIVSMENTYDFAHLSYQSQNDFFNENYFELVKEFLKVLHKKPEVLNFRAKSVNLVEKQRNVSKYLTCLPLPDDICELIKILESLQYEKIQKIHYKLAVVKKIGAILRFDKKDV